MRHHAQLIFVFLVERGLYHIVQAGLQLLTLGDLPSAVQSAEITGINHHAQLPSLHVSSAHFKFTSLSLKISRDLKFG